MEWRRLTVEGLAVLIVDDVRREWILAHYPPSEMGRPGIIHHTPRGEKRNRVRETDAPVAGNKDSRVTVEFDDDEDVLHEELVGVAAD